MKVRLVNDEIKENYGQEILRSRGIEDVERFINPDYTCLEDWRMLANIQEGTQLIRASLDKNQPIALVVDADVDGYTSAAIIYQYLKRLKPNLDLDYFLHSGKQHGLEDTWEAISEGDYCLVITPDSASNDGEYAKELGIPVLVLDHHIVEDGKSSDNMLIINNQSSPLYMNKNLSGAGVVYKFCQALDYTFGVNWASDFIDLAAVGIDGDMMSGLEIENQYIWKLGFNNIKNYFLQVLIEKQSYSMNNTVNPISVAFYIVPLMNAMIRMGTMEEKDRMFQALVDGHKMVPSNKRGAKGTMEEVAVESARECTNARSHQNKFKEETVAKLETKIIKNELLDNKILFIRLDEDDTFSSELNGLVCMQLSAKYKRPTIVARLNDEGYIRGSMRGVNNSGLASFKDFLTDTGLCEYVQGHDNAAGVSIKNINLSRLHEIANEKLAEYDFGEEYFDVNFCRQATATDLKDMVFDLDKYKNIWSQNNNEPLIYITDLCITMDDVQIMGRNKDTLKITKNDMVFIKFFAKEMIKELQDCGQARLELVGKANLNEWMGTYTPQIQIAAYEIKQDSVCDF